MKRRKDELDNFKEKFAKILPIFVQKSHIRIQYNYSVSDVAKSLGSDRIHNTVYRYLLLAPSH
jgi:hypothetical protein